MWSYAQLAILVVAIPWWWPVLRRIVLDVRAAASGDVDPERASTPQAESAWPAAGPGWAKSRLRNTQWDIGRRPPGQGLWDARRPPRGF